MTLWKINCKEEKYPGMWQRWFLNQCVAVGWYAKWGFPLEGKVGSKEGAAGWSRTRKALRKMTAGDFVVVALGGHRVSRLGQITGKEIEDWKPLVPRNSRQPDGEMGRRILVRWDMTTGPENRDTVVLLPEDSRLSLGELRPTIAEIKSITIGQLQSAMNNSENWQSLFAHFDYEKLYLGISRRIRIILKTD